jgi:hypothetical protein
MPFFTCYTPDNQNYVDKPAAIPDVLFQTAYSWLMQQVLICQIE